MNELVPISVVIPTYQREQLLINTLDHLINIHKSTFEIIVVDQTLKHEKNTEHFLSLFDKQGNIRWIRLKTASIPHAMNIGIFVASFPIVLFVDDDIIPGPNLVKAHSSAYQESEDIWAVAGQVLQPGEEPFSDSFSYKKNGLNAHLDFRFCSTSRAWVKSVMAGNLSVRRDKALEIGGFDENFIGVAYRFETEFCRRIWQNGGKVLFEPSAGIRHLRAPRGGIRSYGNHLTSISPVISVGAYYFALKHDFSPEVLFYILKRPFRQISTRFHLRQPWYIPIKLIGEILSFLLAILLKIHGPRYVGKTTIGSQKVYE